MYNVIIINVLDEESDAKKHIGSKEKLAFAELRVLYLRLVKHRAGCRQNMKTKNRLHTFCRNILCHTQSLLFTCKFFNVEKASV